MSEPFRTAAEVLALNALRAIAGAGPDVDTRELAALYVADVEAEIANRQSKATAHGLDTDNAAPF